MSDRTESIRTTYAEKHNKWVEDIKRKVSADDLNEYYSKHSKVETCKHFELPNSSISFLLKEYNIKKDKKDIVSVRENTNMKRYGVKSVTQLDEVKKKVEETCIEKYGCKSNFMTDSFKEQSKKSCLEKYG